MNKVGNEIEDITEQYIPLKNSLTLLAEYQLQQAILFERAILKGILVGQNYPGAKQNFDSIALAATTLSSKVMSELSEIELFLEDSISKLHSAEAAEEYQYILKEVEVISKASVILR
jgi:methyl-accepting chemotaxis protein